MKSCGDSSTVELPLFQEEDGGSSPTSPLQLHFREIMPKTAMIAYRRWHYLGDVEFISQVNFGAYWEQKLEGAISYGPPNATDLKGYWDRHTQNNWFEIKRLALSPLCPRNSESRFIAITTKLLRRVADVKGIVSYADDAQGHKGTIYKASGFESLGMTAPKKDFWVDGRIQQRGPTKGVKGEWRERSRKWLFVKKLNLSDRKKRATGKTKKTRHPLER